MLRSETLGACTNFFPQLPTYLQPLNGNWKGKQENSHTTTHTPDKNGIPEKKDSQGEILVRLLG
jgi:hypothetical protein